MRTRDSGNAVVADYIGLVTDVDTAYTVGQVMSIQVENNVAFVSGALISSNEINAVPCEVVRADVAVLQARHTKSVKNETLIYLV